MASYLAHSASARGRRPLAVVAAAALALALTSCGGAHDPEAGLTKEDYEALKSRRPPPETVRPMKEPPIPDLAPVLAAPQPPLLSDTRRVTVQATEVTPVRDLLIEIARRSDIDLELDPRIEGGIIFTSRDRPLREVVERITDLAGLRYDFVGNRLRVELDEPYLESYRLDVLALSRNTTSSVSTSTDVFSAVGEGSTTGGNGSASTVETSSELDFWTEIASNIEQIIGATDPAIRTVTADPPPAPSAPQGATGTGTGEGATPPANGEGAEEGAAQEPGAPGASALQQAQQIAQAQSEIASPSAPAAGGAPGADAAAAALAGAAGAAQPTQYYTINRQAGMISVYTTEERHEKIAEYLREVRQNIGSQVLIEAKIMEVNLLEEYRAGIDWDVAFAAGSASMGFGNFLSGRDTIAFPQATVDDPVQGIIGAGTSGNFDFEGVIDFMEEFGTTRTLSNPRLTVVNNQSAVLKVAENEVYFTIDIDREIDEEDNTETTTYTSEIHTVPIGVILNVQPSINTETEEVALNLRPTISRITRRVLDPAVELVVADIRSRYNSDVNVQSEIPVVEVREMDSMVTMQSGDVLVLGGLMQERAANSDRGTPGIKDVPVVGMPFRRESKNTEVVELVIFLRATIVNGRDSVDPADVELYNKFTPDPRPIAF